MLLLGEVFLGPMRSFTVKENHIVSVVREIIHYTHTHTQIDILILIYND